ncbi:hypothetical protein [Paenibacillus agilis]|uniref:Uncharacterized protein n=1 Tax=Paenibacillus agilis TaxID=3020863 RepID=A0A559J1P1_9BACL|nr:hypothetical protein [Paenibacillus agilis]TVX93805.1 hypothetical protein FPZ44_12525 [Paenibacillus agilis]
MENVYSRLFQLENYLDEETVDVFMVKDGKTLYDRPCSIPISVATRMICIGQGYGLKYSSLIDVYGDLKLNFQQLDGFKEELMFILELVNDEVLKHYISSLIELIIVCLYDPNKQTGIEVLGA